MDGTGNGTALGSAHYTGVAIALHWIIAVLVLFNLATGLGDDAVPGVLRGMHKPVGITILVLSLIRLGWRFTHPAPPLPAALPAWQKTAARTVYFLLYVFMIAMPLSGWAMVSGPKRRPLDWFGLFDIPYLPVSPEVASLGHEAHELLGWGFLALVIVHISAALWHQFGLRDNLLARMLPKGA